MLTEQQLEARKGKLTASRVGVLVSGSDQQLYDLWREVIGDPVYSAPDLSGVWPVALGSETEKLNLDWYERKRGRIVTRRGEVVVHREYPWAAATLDGWDGYEECPVETKHVGGRESLSTILKRYAAQFHWQMAVTESDHLFASIIEGANEPIVELVNYNHGFGEELWRRAHEFIRCVEEMRPPVTMPEIEAPVTPVVTYDMTGNNEFADSAATWLENKDAVKKAKDSEGALKAMVPADGKRVHGYGVEITRDRANRMSLRAT